MRRRIAVAVGALLVCGVVLVVHGAPSRAGPTTLPPSPATCDDPAQNIATVLGPSDPPPAGTQPPGRPAGLIAVAQFAPPTDSDTLPTDPPFSPTVYATPSIAGVDLRVYWADIEPLANTFNWSIIDQVFAAAAASRPAKFVVLTLVPGFGTPAWALARVQWEPFERQYGPEAGTAGCLPVPWDTAYQSEWKAFLRAVAARYANSSALRMINVDGPTSVSSEISLPNCPCPTSVKERTGDDALPATFDGRPIDRSDLRMWRALHYRPRIYEAAWRTAFRQFAALFPKQYLAVALHPGLPIPSPGQASRTRQSVIAAGLLHRTRFALGEAGLKASKVSGAGYDIVKANCGDVVTGYQLGTAVTKPNSTEGSMHAVLKAGAAAHADFVEVYATDVDAAPTDPAVRRALTSFAHRFPARAGCATPTITLRATPPTGVVGTAVTLTVTTTHLQYADTPDDVNILGPSGLLKRCPVGPRCTVSLQPGFGATTYTADVGPPGLEAGDPQDIVTTSARVGRAKAAGTGPLPTARGRCGCRASATSSRRGTSRGPGRR